MKKHYFNSKKRSVTSFQEFVFICIYSKISNKICHETMNRMFSRYLDYSYSGHVDCCLKAKIPLCLGRFIQKIINKIRHPSPRIF